jgi:hypothetical protein
MVDIYTILDKIENANTELNVFHEENIALIEAGLLVKDAKHKQWYLEKLYERFTGFSRKEAESKFGFKFTEGVSP